MSAKKSINLETAEQTLERVLAESAAPDRAARLDQALAGLEEAVRQQIKSLHPADGRIVKVDRPRIPSPMVDRRAEQLSEELRGFQEEINTLRQKAQVASEEAVPHTDYSALRKRVRQLIEALDHYQEEEAHLILESVNTDIGAGD